MDEPLRLRAHSTLASIGRLRRQVKRHLAARGVDEELVERVEAVVSEAVTNAVVHAYAGQPEPGPVTVEVDLDGEAVELLVVDEGKGLHARDDSPRAGFGMSIMAGLASDLHIVRRAGGRGTLVRARFAPA